MKNTTKAAPRNAAEKAKPEAAGTLTMARAGEVTIRKSGSPKRDHVRVTSVKKSVTQVWEGVTVKVDPKWLSWFIGQPLPIRSRIGWDLYSFAKEISRIEICPGVRLSGQDASRVKALREHGPLPANAAECEFILEERTWGWFVQAADAAGYSHSTLIRAALAWRQQDVVRFLARKARASTVEDVDRFPSQLKGKKGGLL